MNFGRRWRVPKLVLAIPGSAEFLARAPGVWQKRSAIIKAHSLRPAPTRVAPCLASPRFTPLHLASPRPTCRRCRAHTRSLTRSVPLRRVTAVPSSGRRSLGIGKGKPRGGARRREGRTEKNRPGWRRGMVVVSIALTSGTERVGVYGYDAATVTGYTRFRTGVNDAPPSSNPGGFGNMLFNFVIRESARSRLSFCTKNHRVDGRFHLICPYMLIQFRDDGIIRRLNCSSCCNLPSARTHTLCKSESLVDYTSVPRAALSSGWLYSPSHPAREAQGSTRCRSRKKPHPFIRSTKRATKVMADVARARPMLAEVVMRQRRLRETRARETGRQRETERAKSGRIVLAWGGAAKGEIAFVARWIQRRKNLGYFRPRSATVGCKIYTKIQARDEY